MIKRNKTKHTVYLKFQITQHLREKILMENIKKYLGYGRVEEHTNAHAINFIITKFKDIEKIISLFNQYPLQSNKVQDFEDFKKIFIIMKNKHHLTNEGLNQIKIIKSNMNKSRL